MKDKIPALDVIDTFVVEKSHLQTNINRKQQTTKHQHNSNKKIQ